MATPDQNLGPIPPIGIEPHEPDLRFIVGQMWGVVQMIPGRLDTIEQVSRENIAAIHKRLDTNTREISAVKNKQYWFSGVTAAAGVAVGIIAGHLGLK